MAFRCHDEWRLLCFLTISNRNFHILSFFLFEAKQVQLSWLWNILNETDKKGLALEGKPQ